MNLKREDDHNLSNRCSYYGEGLLTSPPTFLLLLSEVLGVLSVTRGLLLRTTESVMDFILQQERVKYKKY